MTYPDIQAKQEVMALLEGSRNTAVQGCSDDARTESTRTGRKATGASPPWRGGSKEPDEERSPAAERALELANAEAEAGVKTQITASWACTPAVVIWKSFSSISTSIVFEELPCVNRFLKLSLVWETGEL